jgi:hypothetical protein
LKEAARPVGSKRDRIARDGMVAATVDGLTQDAGHVSGNRRRPDGETSVTARTTIWAGTAARRDRRPIRR